MIVIKLTRTKLVIAWVRIYEDKVRACDRIDDSIGNAIARDDKEINFALIDQ